MKTATRQTPSTSLQTLERRNVQPSSRTARLDDDGCATSGGTGGLCLHCTGPESD